MFHENTLYNPLRIAPVSVAWRQGSVAVFVLVLARAVFRANLHAQFPGLLDLIVAGNDHRDVPTRFLSILLHVVPSERFVLFVCYDWSRSNVLTFWLPGLKSTFTQPFNLLLPSSKRPFSKTLSLPRVINIKFPLQPHQKYYISTVWRTWVFISYSAEKSYTFRLPKRVSMR